MVWRSEYNFGESVLSIVWSYPEKRFSKVTCVLPGEGLEVGKDAPGLFPPLQPMQAAFFFLLELCVVLTGWTEDPP